MNLRSFAASPGNRGKPWLRRLGFGLVAVGLAYAALLVSERAPPAPQGAGRPVFAWRLDAFWSQLERELLTARGREPAQLAVEIDAAVGLKLWMGVSYLSSPTVTAWLGSIGVRHFETQEPADLEYDPQLRVVAEWRDRATLFKAHVDDAVTEVMFEFAPPGEPLPYARLLLPLARLSKAYSVGLNLLGRVGPIPEGMSATAALRVDRYQAAHRARVARVRGQAEEFQRERGYVPPFWELVRLAREAERRQGGR